MARTEASVKQCEMLWVRGAAGQGEKGQEPEVAGLQQGRAGPGLPGRMNSGHLPVLSPGIRL